jgi:hypothetical protein
MDSLEAMTAREMLAKREATEAEVSTLIGRLVFAYSGFVTALHLCAAWHDNGRDLDGYAAKAEDLGAAKLIDMIERQARGRYGGASAAFKEYEHWCGRAHAIRELRNIVMHSRWGIEAYGRHAIAISTPIFVEPMKEHAFTVGQLRDASVTCGSLVVDLGKLRSKSPL